MGTIIINNFNFKQSLVETPVLPENLILHLDSANIDSYPQSGNLWYDLSPSGSSVNLVGGTSFNPDAKSIVFTPPSYGELVDSTPFQVTDNFTISIWVKNSSLNSNSNPSYVDLWDWSQNKRSYIFYDGRGKNNVIISNDGLSSSLKLTDNVPIEYNSWENLTFTYDGENLGLFRNDTFVAGQSQIPSPIYTDSSLKLNLMSSKPTYQKVRNLQGELSLVLFYNKALSYSEITENYNIYKGRYI